MVVFLLESVDEGTNRRVLVRVVCTEIRVVERCCASEFGDLRIIPAVRADDGRCDADLARLLDDLADLLIVGGDEDDVRIRRAQTRQRRLKVLILREEGLSHENLAAARGKDLLKDRGEALGVVRGVVEIDDGRLGLQRVERELCHNVALLRVDEAAAEDPRLDGAVLDRNINRRCIRCDDRNLVVRGDLRLGDDVCRRRGPDDRADMIVGDQLRRCVHGLCRLGFVVRLDEDNLLAVYAAGIVRLFDRELQPLERRGAVVRRVARHLEIRTDANLIRLGLVAAAARERGAEERRADECGGETQCFSSEYHKYTPSSHDHIKKTASIIGERTAFVKVYNSKLTYPPRTPCGTEDHVPVCLEYRRTS